LCRVRYNTSEHPIPFHKAQDLGKVPKKLAGGPAPDLEEAYVCALFLCVAVLILTRCFKIDDVEDVSDDESKAKDDTDDITKDSLIKATKKRKAPAAKPKAKK
jgi:replication factor C subunit 1